MSSDNRSTTVPKVVVGAGVIAASTLLPIPTVTSDVSGIGDSVKKDIAVCVAKWQNKVTQDRVAGDEQVGKLVLELPIVEEWSETRHGPELRRLIVLKAKSKGILSGADNVRLSNLQRLRRASLPFNMSYEEFIKERDRKEELRQLMDLLEDYKLKYNSTVHG